MTEKEKKEFRKAIQDEVKRNFRKTVYKDNLQKIRQENFFNLSQMVLYFMAPLALFYLSSGFWYGNFYNIKAGIFFSISCLLPFIIIRGTKILLMTYQEGKEKDTVEEWLWKAEKKYFINATLLITMFAVWVNVFLYKYNGCNTLMNFILVYSILYTAVLAIIIKKPSLFLSRSLNFLGDFFLQNSGLLSLLLIPCFFLEYIGKVSLPSNLLILFFVIFAIFIVYITTNSEEKVSLTQKNILTLVNPRIILEELKSDKQKIKEEVEAYETFISMVNKSEYTKQKILLELLAKKHGNNNQNWVFTFLGLLMGLTLYFLGEFIGALIEPIAQTLFTDHINEFLCNSLGLKKFCK